MPPSATKSKRDRATHEQLEIYVAFCKAHPEMISGRKCPKTPQHMRKLWQELTEKLNYCRGPTRKTAKWKETFCVWKSQLRTRSRRSTVSLRTTSAASNLKPMSAFEKKALALFASDPAVDVEEDIESISFLGNENLIVECPTSPTTENAASLDSPQLLSSDSSQPVTGNRLSSDSSTAAPCPMVILENNYSLKDAYTSQLSRDDRNKLINTLLANIAERNDNRQRFENERRQEHREMVQAIHGLNNTVAELVNVLKQNLINKVEIL